MKYLTAKGALMAVVLAVAATPAMAGDYGPGYRNDCYKCPQPRPNYDSTEVIKQTRDVDRALGEELRYDKRTGLVTIECRRCKKLVAHVKVASE